MFASCLLKGRHRAHSGSDEEARLPFPEVEAISVQKMMNSWGLDVGNQLRNSLQETVEVISKDHFAEETVDWNRSRARTFSDLNEYLEGKPMKPPASSLGPATGDSLIGVSGFGDGVAHEVVAQPAGDDGNRGVVVSQESDAETEAAEAEQLSRSREADGNAYRSRIDSWNREPTGEPETSGGYSPSKVANLPTHMGVVTDHAALVRSIYEEQGLDFNTVQGLAREFLAKLRLRPYDSGVHNVDEKGEMLMNQCFYLSLAHGYLGMSGDAHRQGLALRLRRAIEAAVVAAHPAWELNLTRSAAGGQAMVFADFLPHAMKAPDTSQEPNLLAKLVVCIFDSVGGTVEVYLGPGYCNLKDNIDQMQNLILLWYTPGHYQCLVNDDDAGTKATVTYDDFKQLLTEHGVVYIETTE